MTERVSTEPPEISVKRMRRGRAMRRVFFVCLCALLVAAALGLLGSRTSETTASGGEYELVVRYPSITRPGLATQFEIEVTREGGFPGIVTLAISSSYLDIFDENGFDPDPLGATTDPERLVWSFEPPKDSDTMAFSFDARTEPGVQLKRAAGSVAVLEDNRPVVTARFKTLVLP
ncbi:MAG: hypothetical protein LC733_02665 [Actinobacteria bacterium]|nr:hypothetical protein [Actinomycetota bacterium]